MKSVTRISILLGFAIISFFKPAIAQQPADIKLAQSYFHEFDSLCTADNGTLWGVKLNGPTMLVFSNSRQIIANQMDGNKVLTEKEELFVGTLPEEINLANTSFEWSGTNWTMVLWDALSPTDKYSRNKLLIHESWHRIQTQLGVNAVMTANAYLDELQGAILLKLEFVALKNALLAAENADKKANLKNALVIRKYRQLLFPGNNENEFERFEGMAEYTGFKLCGINKALLPRVVAKQLELAMSKGSLANSFAYITGPGYGFLFDQLNENWIATYLQGNDLAEIASEIIETPISADTAALKIEVSKIISQYDAQSFVASETEKFKADKELVAEYRKMLVDGDLLIFPNNGLKFTFNPQEKLIPIDDIGVVYKTMRVTGEWGILEVNNGILRTNDWMKFIVSAPQTATSGTIVEHNYILTLNKGWKVVKIKEGKYTVKD